MNDKLKEMFESANNGHMSWHDLSYELLKMLDEQKRKLDLLQYYYDTTVGLNCCDRELSSLPDPDRIFFKLDPIPELTALNGEDDD